ncbi:MAG: hypothetical protein WC911_02155 [Thermoleophilia bacterium]
MTPEQIKRLLALPVKWRKKLAEQEAPGRWFAMIHGEPMEMSDDRPFNRPTDRCTLDAIDGGWAWAPCDSAAWMKAASEGLGWMIGPTCVIDARSRSLMDTTFSSNPIDCALLAMEKNP